MMNAPRVEVGVTESFKTKLVSNRLKWVSDRRWMEKGDGDDGDYERSTAV